MGSSWSTPGPEVSVATGRLRGKTDVVPGVAGTAGTRYIAFLGIPYGKPPVGELRFKAPEPAEPWEGVRDATTEGNPCYQSALPTPGPSGLTFKLIIGILKNISAIAHRVAVAKKQSEDCLFLNVFSPQSAFPEEGKEAPLRPVLFWVHGGAFKLGDGNPDVINPDLFLEKNIVVVTINYRLGAFGFLSLGTADVPGNAGLKDQALALKWTRDNIRAFGGDPDAITIYGESAGGASSHYLSISPLCKGMFRSVINSSGSSVVHWASTTNALRCARGLAAELGLEADTPEELAKALRTVSAPKLLHASEKMTPIFDCFTDELMFLPVVEPDHPGAFNAEDPVVVLRSGKAAPVPIMTGINSAEGLVSMMFMDPSDDKLYKHINERPYYFLPPDLRTALSKEQRDKCVQDILEEYTGGKPFSRDNVNAFVQLYGDVMFSVRQKALVNLHTEAGTSPLYLYLFDFVGKLNALKALTKSKMGKGAAKVPGAAHGDDLWYLGNIRLLPVPGVAPDSREMLTKKRMVQLWANFIETGNPTPPGTDKSLIPVEWTPCTPTSHPFMHIENDLKMSEDALFAKQAFWEGLYQKYLGKPQLV